MSVAAPDLPLFAYGKARRSDPATSQASARAAGSLVQADQRSILRAMGERGAPLAAEQISDHLAWNDHVRVNRRLSELVDAAAIERTEEQHINRSGRAAYRYRLKSREAA